MREEKDKEARLKMGWILSKFRRKKSTKEVVVAYIYFTHKTPRLFRSGARENRGRIDKFGKT